MADTQSCGISGQSEQSRNTKDSLTTHLDELFEAFWARITAQREAEQSKLLENRSTEGQQGNIDRSGTRLPSGKAVNKQSKNLHTSPSGPRATRGSTPEHRPCRRRPTC
ncbi:Hypothetical predicted protein [Pelobates cultripes]|uniref:Uncharacterized protein n=1 Tax=Pelobates cultripes TaxID=61616 RepID=A0AAD1SKK8_PELCU|nr:Hypothetical predicted protein [Pelobates cultripes]